MAHDDAHDHHEHEHHAHDHHEHEHHEHQHAISYADAVAEFRADKDAFFKSANGSPIPAAERDAFDGLPYYPVDEALRIDGLVLAPYTGTEPVRFEIPTSDGRLRPAERAGVFHFPLGGSEHTLTGYRFAGDDDAWCSSRSSTRRAGPRPTVQAAISTSKPRTTAHTRSTSTSRTTRHACTTRSSRARSRLPRTGCPCGSRPANGSVRAGRSR